MSRSDCIAAAIIKELDRRKRVVDTELELDQLLFRVKFDKRGKIFRVRSFLEFEHEEEKVP
jgi:hypothetical protein